MKISLFCLSHDQASIGNDALQAVLGDIFMFPCLCLRQWEVRMHSSPNAGVSCCCAGVHSLRACVMGRCNVSLRRSWQVTKGPGEENLRLRLEQFNNWLASTATPSRTKECLLYIFCWPSFSIGYKRVYTLMFFLSLMFISFSMMCLSERQFFFYIV